MKPSLAANDNQIDRTLEVWRPRLRRSLTADDARQIAANVTGFFSVLAEWSQAEMPAPANDVGPAGDSAASEVSHDR